jgi:hypothetical protein
MVAQIENYLDTYLINIIDLFDEWNRILKSITISKNENELRSNMKLFVYKYFKYGFGGNHMWVIQKNKPERRIIIVELK